MKKLAMLITAAAVVGTSVWFFTRVEESQKSALHETAHISEHSAVVPAASEEPESEIIQARTRTNESFESEFRSYSNKELRREVESVNAQLEPIFSLSNRQALTLSQRVTVVNGLRKRQALLKILIDRRLELAEQRGSR